MPGKLTLDQRRDRLGAAIAAARARLAARQNLDDASIGALLSTVNDEFDQIVHEDEDEAERAYKRIEARLAAEKIRIEDDEEEEDR
jgi:hypothetical protein